MVPHQIFRIILSLYVLLTVLESQIVSKAEVLFEKAKYVMESQGDLLTAINIFEKITKKYPEDRELAAKSLLYIGLCYEKMGNREAREAYQTVIENYTDQQAVVAEARLRLLALDTIGIPTTISMEKPGITIREIWGQTNIPEQNLNTPSPNGRYISYVDQHGGDLVILDLAAKEKRRLTNNWQIFKSLEENGLSQEERDTLKTIQYTGNSIWSPDSKQIVYDRFYGGRRSCFLYIRTLNEENSRLLYQNKSIFYLTPFDWSPNGKDILVLVEMQDGVGQLSLVSVQDGSLNYITESPIFDLTNYKKLNEVKFLFSPDDRFIVFHWAENKMNRDIFLIPRDGGTKVTIVNHPADDFVIGWSPDGKYLCFASDRTGTLDVWIIPVKDGKAIGNPELIKKNLGPVIPIGLAKNGSFYFGQNVEMQEVYSATLDLKKSVVVKSPRRVTQRFVGTNNYPDWSPDGKYLAYLSMRDDNSGALTVLCIQSLETSEVKEITPGLISMGPIRWAPDSQSLLVPGMDVDRNKGIFSIDAQAGHVKLEMKFKDPDARVRWVMWSPDKQYIYFKYSPTGEHMSSRLMQYDVKSGQEKELYSEVSWPTFMALSPDGESLAFITLKLVTLTRYLNIMPSGGGKPRRILEVKKDEMIYSIAWTPDGQTLLYSKGIKNSNKRQLWQISINGGDPQEVNLAMERLGFLSVHPDGERVAFSTLKQSLGIWAMENFLPRDEIK